MQGSDDRNDRIQRDPLGEIIHAAGRRQPPPREHYESVRAASRRAWQVKVRARRRRRWYALAASVAIIGGVGALFQMSQQGASTVSVAIVLASGQIDVLSDSDESWAPLTPDSELVPGNRLRTADDGRAALAIAGGGSLRVNTNTELTVGEQSFELIVGTVYVDSEERSGPQPIRIATEFGTVEDIGTQFEVRATSESLRVRVRTGRVELLESPLPSDFRSGAGQEFELLASGSLQTHEIAPDHEAWSWAEALAVAPSTDNPSVLGYLQWIARETGKRLRFDAPNTELSAQFVRWSGDPRGLTPLQVLSAITATSDFSYELTDDGVILIRRRDNR